MNMINKNRNTDQNVQFANDCVFHQLLQNSFVFKDGPQLLEQSEKLDRIYPMNVFEDGDGRLYSLKDIARMDTNVLASKRFYIGQSRSQ